MTTKILKLSVACFAAAASLAGGVNASEPLEVSVAGRIKPAGTICVTTLYVKPVMDYGVIPANTLEPDSNGVSILVPQDLGIGAKCSQPSKFSVRFVDGQPGTAVTDEKFVRSIMRGRPLGVDLDESYLFGLGQDSQGRNIGALLVQSTTAPRHSYINDAGEEQRADGVWLEGAGTTWEDLGFLAVLRSQRDYTVVPIGHKLPMPNLTSMMLIGQIAPAIDTRPGHLDMKNDVDFNGRITVEVKQL